MNRSFALSTTLLLASIQILLAFSPSRQTQRLPVRFARVSGVRSQPTAATSLWMADDNENEEVKPEESESAAKSTGEGVEEPEAEEPKEEAEEPKEDPEILALKEEIAGLESTLKNKKNTLSYTQEQAEEYSKAGYARKVAEMENMRRARSNMNSSSRSSATATVLADFLPVYDKMNSLKEKYSNDQFGSKYGGLSMDSTFAKMGVKDYTAAVGKPLDSFRMAAVESEYSTEFAKDAVIRPVAMGMELEGNVIRAAECVVSLGEEEEEETEEEAEDERNQEEGEDNSSE